MASKEAATADVGAVASLSEETRRALGTQLRAMSTVVLGRAADGGHTNRALKDLGPLIESGDVLFVPCDAGDEEYAACMQAGIKMTPTLIVGGQRVEGYKSFAAVAEAVEAAGSTARALSARGAKLYGRASCIWTQRQRATLGVHVGSSPEALVPYVECEDTVGSGAHACEAAGVTAVPAWRLGSGPVVPGFRPLPALQALAGSDDAALKAAAAAGRKGAGMC